MLTSTDTLNNRNQFLITEWDRRTSSSQSTYFSLMSYSGTLSSTLCRILKGFTTSMVNLSYGSKNSSTLTKFVFSFTTTKTSLELTLSPHRVASIWNWNIKCNNYETMELEAHFH